MRIAFGRRRGACAAGCAKPGVDYGERVGWRAASDVGNVRGAGRREARGAGGGKREGRAAWNAPVDQLAQADARPMDA